MNSTVKLLSTPENCDSKVEMLVLVHSHPYDKGGELQLWVRLCFKNQFSDSREIIRSSWGKTSLLPRAVKLVFVVGIVEEEDVIKEVDTIKVECIKWNFKILDENRNYNDILFGDFIQSRKNSTLRAIFGMTWVSVFCGHVSFVGKIIHNLTILQVTLP